MAGQGLFRVQTVSAGNVIAEPFGDSLFYRVLVTNQDTSNDCEIELNGVTDNIAAGEQIEYVGESTLFKVDNIVAPAVGSLVVRVFT